MREISRKSAWSASIATSLRFQILWFQRLNNAVLLTAILPEVREVGTELSLPVVRYWHNKYSELQQLDHQVTDSQTRPDVIPLLVHKTEECL